MVGASVQNIKANLGNITRCHLHIEITKKEGNREKIKYGNTDL